ncbi:MAG TPA: TonB-dependent receptor [Xanthomonadales bacterium]|nr:TonB-dependent receptor [Xanthomonadales bacterium]
MRMSRTTLATAIAAALIAALPCGAIAQESVDEDDRAEAPSQLEEVTVTARRREESIQEVPVAVSAFERDELTQMQATEVDDLQGAVPNMNIVQGRGSSNSINVFIRGIGQPDALQTFDPGVGMYIDDVYYSRIQGALFSLFDVERIEVLRGPQGTLYGKNSTGGAVKIVTREPGEEFGGAFEWLLGNHGRFEERFYVTGPASESVALSAAGALTNSDGYVEDPVTGGDYNEDDTGAARVKMAWRPSDSFSATFSADYTHQDNNLTLGRPEAPLVQVDLVRGPVVLRPGPTGEYDYETRTSFGPGQDQQLRHRGIAGVLEWQLSDAWLVKSITSRRWLDTNSYIDIDASELELGDVLVALDQDQTSQELQLQYDDGGALEAVFGLYYLDEDVPSHQEAYADSFLAAAGAPISFLRTVDDDLRTRSWAAFAHGSWEFAPSWTLSAGVRYTDEEKEYDRSTSTFSNLAALNGTFAFSASDSWDATTPSLSLEKAFGDDAIAYLSANKGFKSGGFNGRANTPGEVSSFDPEEVWTYEAGFKWTSSDRRLLANVAVFHSEYKDFQARVSEVQNPGAPIPTFSFPVLNAAELSIDGVEFEGIALVGEATQLSAQVGWLDAKYDEFIDPRIVVNPALAGLHEHVPFSPEWTARFAATHSFYFEGGSVFTLGGDVSYRDDTWLSVDNRDVLMQDAYTLVGVYGIWDSADGHWQVRGGVKNATDKLYKTEGQEFSSVGNIQTAYYGWPRQVYAAIRYTF